MPEMNYELDNTIAQRDCYLKQNQDLERACVRHKIRHADLLEACEASLSTIKTVLRLGKIKGAARRMMEIEAETLENVIAKVEG